MPEIETQEKMSVFTSLDLHTNKLLTDQDLRIIMLDRGKVQTAVKPLRKLINSIIEAEFGVKNIVPTFPLVLSSIREGRSVHDYTRAHVDLESYEETLIHFTSILYLRSQSLQGGESEAVISDYKHVSGQLHFDDGTIIVPTLGKLIIFTGGAENVHWVEKVTGGLRVAITLFWTCDTEYQIDI